MTRFPGENQRDIHRDCGDYCYKGWRHSLCHGWAAGPTAWLSQHVLGVEVSQGGTKVKIAPHLGDLEWAQGTFPTPQGPLQVSHRRENGEVVTEYQAPTGVEVALEKPQTMIRKAFVMQLHPGQEAEYQRRHNPIWPELEATLQAHGARSYSIFLLRETNQLFAYAEIEDEARWNAIAQTEVCQRWWTHMADLMATNPDSSPQSVELPEVFHLAETSGTQNLSTLEHQQRG